MIRTIRIAVAFSCLSLPSIASAQMEVEVVPPVPAGEPPAAKKEPRPACPSPQHIFVEGHWAWRNNAYVWTESQWTVPPTATCQWAPARYEKKDKGWYFREGYWRDLSGPAAMATEQPDTATAAVDRPPPMELVEAPGKAPFAHAFWTKGHWYWSGHTWQWAAGHWEQEHTGYTWQNAHWTRQNATMWGFTAGHWKHI